MVEGLAYSAGDDQNNVHFPVRYPSVARDVLLHSTGFERGLSISCQLSTILPVSKRQRRYPSGRWFCRSPVFPETPPWLCRGRTSATRPCRPQRPNPRFSPSRPGTPRKWTIIPRWPSKFLGHAGTVEDVLGREVIANFSRIPLVPNLLLEVTHHCFVSLGRHENLLLRELI